MNQYCRQAYFQNFGDYPEADIPQVYFTSLPKVNLITPGFPCQPFSI
ncbi:MULTISPECIES: DNA cytosine methyltransferase [Oscillatoriales]|nr:DNA cytosine methyltransferase [Arthrospira platensis FACHB-971]MBD2668970.1 DNA cytosine methyltransferase [Arthrospira platensis FACHB-439]MBD2709406.1 DNA cytosine methyltransferase [Arthrospira platensis FACHB-835]QJB29704.1 DNA cytosine methyltransferase [Limnospira fusiformis SAG 85.79]QNH60091.1 MAG: DNA cytosine methyltransferase [Limnospira indica BM01]